MPNVMAALPNIGEALCSMPQSLVTPTIRVPCSNAAKTRNPLKLAGVPQTNEMISAASAPKKSSQYCKDMCRRYCCLTSFFPIVDMCLSCEDIALQVVRWCPHGEFLAIFYVLYFQRAACSMFQTCILNSH